MKTRRLTEDALIFSDGRFGQLNVPVVALGDAARASQAQLTGTGWQVAGASADDQGLGRFFIRAETRFQNLRLGMTG